MMAGGEYQAEKWLLTHLFQLFVGAPEQVFVRDTPGTPEYGIVVVILIGDGLKAVVQEKTAAYCRIETHRHN